MRKFVTESIPPISTANTAIVSASGGDYSTLQAAVAAVASWCSGATATNRCVIRLMPGKYIVTTVVEIPEFMDVVGQGATNTVISRSTATTSTTDGVLRMGNQTNLVGVTIKKTGTTSYSTGIYLNAAIVKLDRIAIDVTGATVTNYGVNVGNSAGSQVSIYDSDIKVHGITARSRGVYFSLQSGPGLEIKRSTINAECANCVSIYGVYSRSKSNFTDVTIEATDTAVGSISDRGIYTLSADTTTVDRCRITSSGEGIRESSTGDVRIFSSRISGALDNIFGTFSCYDTRDGATYAELDASCN